MHMAIRRHAVDVIQSAPVSLSFAYPSGLREPDMSH